MWTIYYWDLVDKTTLSGVEGNLHLCPHRCVCDVKPCQQQLQDGRPSNKLANCCMPMQHACDHRACVYCLWLQGHSTLSTLHRTLVPGSLERGLQSTITAPCWGYWSQLCGPVTVRGLKPLETGIWKAGCEQLPTFKGFL